MIPLTRKEFIKEYYTNVVDLIKGTGIFIETLMAQAIIESQGKVNGNYMVGGSTLAKKYNNLFGIKADSSWQGKKVNLKTGEVFSGQYVVITDAFRVYDSPLDSMKDYIKFLQKNPRYTKYGVFTAKDYAQQAQALKAAGYATAPDYANVVTAVGDYVKRTIKELKDKKQIFEPGSGIIKPSGLIIFLIALVSFMALKK